MITLYRLEFDSHSELCYLYDFCYSGSGLEAFQNSRARTGKGIEYLQHRK